MTSTLYPYPPCGADAESDLSHESSEDEEEADDTDIASDVDHVEPKIKREPTEMREQMYQDKLADLKRQLAQLKEGVLPEYIKKLRRAEFLYRERIRVTGIIRDLEVEMVDQDFINEKKASAREFEEHKVYLREQLIQELEEKQKHIEQERHNMELTGDSMELKTISTRKLRRRANEPSNSGNYGSRDNRRKPNQLTSVTYMLDDGDIMDDVKIINKNKALSSRKSLSNSTSEALNSSSSGMGSSSSPSASATASASNYHFNIRVEDGKLFYQKRWFRRGQAIQVEQPKTGEKFAAMISAVGSEAIWIRKTNDSSKIRIYISQLTKGKYLIKRRAN